MELQAFQLKLASAWRIIKYPLLIVLLTWLIKEAIPVFDRISASQPDYLYILYAAGVYQAGILLIALRFHIMLKCMGIWRSYKLCLTSYLEAIPYFFISPGGIGIEFVRYAKLKDKDDFHNIERGPIIFALIADRVIGLISGIAVALMGWGILSSLVAQYISLPYLTICAFAGLLTLTIVSIFMLKRFVPSSWEKLLNIMIFLKSNPRETAVILALGLLSQISLGVTTYLIAKSVHIDISIITTLWVTAAGMVLLVIPVSAFGFTFMDVTVVLLYTICGLSFHDATFLALVGYFMRLWLGMQGGGLELLTFARQGLSFKKVS